MTPLFVDTTPSTGPYIDDTNIMFEANAGQQTNNHTNVDNTEALTITQIPVVDNIKEHYYIQQNNVFIDHQMPTEGEIQAQQFTQNVSTGILGRSQSNPQQLPVRKSNRDTQLPA